MSNPQMELQLLTPEQEFDAVSAMVKRNAEITSRIQKLVREHPYCTMQAYRNAVKRKVSASVAPTYVDAIVRITWQALTIMRGGRYEVFDARDGKIHRLARRLISK